MFSGTKKHELGRTKVTNILSDGLGPFIRDTMAKTFMNTRFVKLYSSMELKYFRKKVMQLSCKHLKKKLAHHVKTVMCGQVKVRGLPTTLMNSVFEKNYEMTFGQVI